MREAGFEDDRGNGSRNDPDHKPPFYREKLRGPGSALGAAAFGLAIAILWAMVPYGPDHHSMLAGMLRGGIEGSIPGRILASDAVDQEAAQKDEAGPLVITPEGDVIVAASPDKVLLVRADRDGDGYTDGVATLMRGLRDPHSLSLDGDWLYVAEAERIIRVRFHARQGKVSGAQEIVVVPADRRTISIMGRRTND